MIPTPTRFHQIDARTLGVDWSDGTEHVYVVRELRLRCPCAGCVSEVTGERILDPTQVPEDVHPVSFDPMGHYGVRIRWSDGHHTGIYSFETLQRWGEEGSGEQADRDR